MKMLSDRERIAELIPHEDYCYLKPGHIPEGMEDFEWHCAEICEKRRFEIADSLLGSGIISLKSLQAPDDEAEAPMALDPIVLDTAPSGDITPEHPEGATEQPIESGIGAVADG